LNKSSRLVQSCFFVRMLHKDILISLLGLGPLYLSILFSSFYIIVYSARSCASPSTWIHSNTTLWCILNGLHAAGYKSAECEPIWMKFGKLSAKCWGLAMADFGRDPRSSHSLTESRKMFVFGQVNNARFHRFPVGQFSRILHTTTSIGFAM